MDNPTSIFKSLPARAVIVWLFAALVGMLLSSHTWWNALNWDALLYLCFLVGFASLPAVRNYWIKRQISERRFITAVVLLMLVGQIAQNERTIFPLTSWNMYGKEDAVEKEVVEFVGVTKDGRRYQLNPAVAFPSLGRGTLRIHNQMEGLARGFNMTDEGDLKDEFANLLKKSLKAVAKQHEHDGRTPPLAKVEVYRFRPQTAETKRLLVEFELEAEGTSL